jgi:hypothetical protein
MIKTCRLGLALLLLSLPFHLTFAQVPGDGIPDVYLATSDFLPIFTSVGEITRSPGTIVVDTDGNDLVALLIEGPDVLATTPDNGGC